MNETNRSTVPAAEEILGKYFPVLDHGFVALVDYMGGDEDIEEAARVAYGHGTRATSETRGLLRYLHRHRHTSPSEMVELKFHCCMPIFVARQWIRHRTANVNEMSGRYSLLPMQFYTPPMDQLRSQSKTNKQGREGELDEFVKREAHSLWNDQRREAIATYQWLVDNDFARELARIDLPLSTYTQWYWKIDLHNLLHFLTLRVDSHAQWEIQQYGQIMAGMLKRVAPLAYEAWIDYDVCGVRLSRMEVDLLRWLDMATRPLGHNGGSVLDIISDDAPLKKALSTREFDEFMKIFKQTSATPNFDLDLSVAKDSTYFEEQCKAAALKG